MFIWRNLLLCCAECGRLKGQKFPVDEAGRPLLLDPTDEDPWQHLDFDPETGNVVPRFDVEQDTYSPKGKATVDLLNLDQREALARAYLRTYRRLVKIADEAVEEDSPNAAHLIERLRELDDNGLIAWGIRGAGKNTEPFCRLREMHPDVWDVCCQLLP